MSFRPFEAGVPYEGVSRDELGPIVRTCVATLERIRSIPSEAERRRQVERLLSGSRLQRIVARECIVDHFIRTMRGM